MDQKRLKNDLQKIIEICKDGVKGYETAAENIRNDEMKTLFLRLSQQRKAFIEDLKNEALKLGIEPEESASVQGFFHRSWIATKAVFSNNSNEKVIEESMTGEKAALETYDEVLGAPEIPRYLKELLVEQQRLIKVAIQQLSGLKTEV